MTEERSTNNFSRAQDYLLREMKESDGRDLDAQVFLLKLVKARLQIMEGSGEGRLRVVVTPSTSAEEKVGVPQKRRVWRGQPEEGTVRVVLAKADLAAGCEVPITEALVLAVMEAHPDMDRTAKSIKQYMYKVRAKAKGAPYDTE